MRAAETAAQLAEFNRRGAGTDAERRAAAWLAGELRAGRRQASLETFWCRPNWALAHAWHALTAIIGSLVMASHAFLGGALVLVALLSTVLDWLTGRSIGRRLTREHASQNVVSPAPDTPKPAEDPPSRADRRVRVIVTANYDAGRTGLACRDALRAPTARIKRLAGEGRFTPGWLGWLIVEMVLLLAVAVARHGSSGPATTPVGILQLIPTAALVVQLALLLDLATAPHGPAAGDNAAGAAVALTLVKALDAAPPRRMTVELVLSGAGDSAMAGLRRHLRRRRGQLEPADTIVLGIGPCGGGHPCWWVSDGPLVPLGFHHRLRSLAERAGGPATPLAATRHRGRGTSPALPARMSGLPALTIGCVDARGLAPRSHQRADVPERLDAGAMDALLEFALLLVDAIDADLARATGAGAGRRTAAPA
jgi:hypothetical protein